MNKQRRDEIAKIIAQIDNFKGELETQRDELDTIKSDEEDAFNNMPESLQESERGQASQAAAEKLQEAYEAIDNACTSLQEALDAMEEASE